MFFWLVVIALAVAYWFSRRVPSKPRVRLAPLATTPEDVDAEVERVAGNANAWRAVPAHEKLYLLREMLAVLAEVHGDGMDMSAKLRGFTGTPYEGWGRLAGGTSLPVFLNGLIDNYTHLAAKGVPAPVVRRRQVGDAEVAHMLPRPDTWSKATAPTVFELWGLPGSKLVQANGPSHEPRVCAVMCPGNFEGPCDALHQLFIEGNVVVLKSHPINAVATDFVNRRVFATLSERGFVGLCSGGPEVGQRLLHHAKVQTWMMTGGCMTYDAIVWGGAQGKAAGKRVLSKECHSELGAASPYIVVPGQWTAQELQYQARVLVAAKLFNAGHICASPQNVLLDRKWPQAKEFVAAVEKQFSEMPPLKPYYTGTDDRLAALKKKCPDAVVFPQVNVHLVRDVDAPGGGGDYLPMNEVFAPALGIKYLDGGSAAAFLDKAVNWSNSAVNGSLSLTVVVDPTTTKALGDKLEDALRRLKWGTIGVNVWPALGSNCAWATWGAPPGRHTDLDIQSGQGLQGNCTWLSNVEKTVMRGAWCDPLLGQLFSVGPKSAAIATRFAFFARDRSVSTLARFVLALVIGK